jgi:hypothetical protein
MLMRFRKSKEYNKKNIDNTKAEDEIKLLKLKDLA